jgi:cation diffusion facilitator CzcD-associated flavoprotein CzcO
VVGEQIPWVRPPFTSLWWCRVDAISSSCACDVPSHNYTWSFEPKLDWSSVYPPAEEIYEYFEGFARKYALHQYVRLRHQVVGARWDHATGGYDVEVHDLEEKITLTDRCDILINAAGILNKWKWPNIPGLRTFKGTLLHTARWDPEVSLEGKHVGIIGNGASGIQLLPAIRERCSKVTTFIREPAWVSPAQGLEQHCFSDEEMRKFAETPGALLAYRKRIESGLNGQFGLFLRDSRVNRDTQAYMERQMREKLGDGALAEKLIPRWSLGCRRLTPGVDYLESLTQPNVDVVFCGVTRVTERGCVGEDGREYPVDILVCATGFDASYRPRFPIVSPAGENLQDRWADAAPESYLGVAVAGFPNYFCMIGPSSPVGNGPVLSGVEAQADWILKVVDRLQTTGATQVSPRAEAVRDFVEHKERFMARTVWTEGCRSWYKPLGTGGPVVALWPGSTLHYIEAMREVHFEDLEFRYEGNRFAWLGNGYSQTELDDTADWAYYIREEDNDAPLSTGGRRRLVSKSGTVGGRETVKFSGMQEDEEGERMAGGGSARL